MKRRKKNIRTLASAIVLTVSLSSFGMGASANTYTQTTLPTVELLGNFDVTSSKPVTVIIQLTEESIIEAKKKGKGQTKQRLATERGKVVKALQNKIGKVKVNREYDYVFSGFSLEVPANEIPNLLATPGVKAVYPNVEYQVTSDTQSIDSELFSPTMLASAPHIGSNKAWDAGYTGEGVTVAVIDTGTDYTHPDLEGSFGAYKGYDFVDNDNDPQETPAGDPRGAATDHGTHVAGTVAADGQIKGVAPDATLLAYRVLGPGGRGTTENVIAGIEKAVEDGANVMNLSLGNSLNNPDFATSIALDWAMAEGVVAVTSNGNSGPNNWTVGSPGTSRQAISVGATQLPYNIYSASLFTSEGVSYPSAAVMGFPNDQSVVYLSGKELEFVNVGLGRAQDVAGKDLTGKIALISRGEIPFVEKADNAKAQGAVGAIIYNHLEGEIPDVAGMAVPTVRLTKADGEKLLAELAAGKNTVKFTTALSKSVGETVASFSSRGPVESTWMIKPDVSAPGVNINSTIPGGYGAKQGTSMASPHVAGAAALLLQAKPNYTVDQVKAALMNTAAELVDPNGHVYPHNTQGAGSIRVVDAIGTQTLVTPGSHSFGVYSNLESVEERQQFITIQNLSNERKKYTFDVAFKGNPAGIKVVTSKNLNVQSKSTQKVNFKVEVDASKLTPGYYEGTIKVSDGKQTIDVPTILFVQNPYHLTTFSYGQNANGGYDMNVELPGGADRVTFTLSKYTNGAIGDLLGTVAQSTDNKVGLNTYTWDGKLNGSKVPAGTYVMGVIVLKDGQTQQKNYLVPVQP
ncbi:S8 family serine peptidase [Bacillus sp. 31A1R]|uniref:S8 family serine peptidase n=1 Tax=Robertmurraya mangrovi TaxID=3098077 RepID=A0ABU5J3B7_9BACI|nr:S8 family serine peptidase [Bacillus sp. 31A1R]MDZ5473915.1 S8 family serine peptidase [Bacillus sp. 31A1R]